MNRGFADKKYLVDKIRALEAELKQLRKVVRDVTVSVPAATSLSEVPVITVEWWWERRRALEDAIEPKAAALAAPCPCDELRAQLAEALEPLKGAGDRTMVPGSVVLSEGFFDRVIRAALSKLEVSRDE